ncbi:MAG: hypothetical protein IMZ64_12035 [Bacteroidetes bacterium]|nr:hypothetical protein [Bacteroidota bacterium]
MSATISTINKHSKVPPPSFTINNERMAFLLNNDLYSTEGTNNQISITTAATWTIQISDAWINTDMNGATGNATMFVSVDTAASGSRNGTIKFYVSGEVVATCNIEQYTDWYLPSTSELDAMYTELHAYSVGGFTSDIYWSSRELIGPGTYAFSISFVDGLGYTYLKSSTYRVRAIRDFTSATIYNMRGAGPGDGLIFRIEDLNDGNYKYYQAAPTDQSTAKLWSNISTLIGATAQGQNIGTGEANTAAIIGQGGHTDSAAKLCKDLIE